MFAGGPGSGAMERAMIGIPIGLMVSNVTEWWVHKHVLHDAKPNGFWNFHLYEHHANVLKNEGRDPAYEKPWWSSSPRRREVYGLVAMTLPFVALAPVAPFLAGTVVYCSVDYYRKHKRSHVDTAWAREHLPWHWDHHMGPDQHANWCVTRPWTDRLRGTRKTYLGTADEARMMERRARIKASLRPA